MTFINTEYRTTWLSELDKSLKVHVVTEILNLKAYAIYLLNNWIQKDKSHRKKYCLKQPEAKNIMIKQIIIDSLNKNCSINVLVEVIT